MLAEAVVRIGKPIVKSNLSNQERIRFLTDVSSENCKNYFQNVFIIELSEDGDVFHKITVGMMNKKSKKESFEVNTDQCTSFPIIYPNGGNPLKAQGIYPIPCYLMYDPHIKGMKDPLEFSTDVLTPRLASTVSYQHLNEVEIEGLSLRIANILAQEYANFISRDKQLGILLIYDEGLHIYKSLDQRTEQSPYLRITESRLTDGRYLFLKGDEALRAIIDAKFKEAGSLGEISNAISTFTNEKVDKAVSIYNKSWLWLSPTWEMPRSIYWGDKEWTKGIKVDRESYEAFLYGSQLLKQIQVPILGTILKDLFAPNTSVEAKKHMKATSFEPIYGVPMVLPLLDGDSKQLFKKFKKMLDKEMSDTDLNLDVLAGMDKSFIPESLDDHRLMILYYSGDLSRGNMHIRAVIEDVIPSVASEIQRILQRLKSSELKEIQNWFGLDESRMYRTETLPALLANANGPGYLWSSLQSVFHRQPLTLERLLNTTAIKLNELANKEDAWNMKQELIFYYSFVYFLNRYDEHILRKEKGVKELADWNDLIHRYHQGTITLEDVQFSESLGFVTGLLVKQFSDSYYQKTKKDFVKHRVMKFGSKLTPGMIRENGVDRCEELAQQWDMKLAGNFRKVLSQVLLGFLDGEEKKWRIPEKNAFMTAFWAGNLIYQQTKPKETTKEAELHVNS